MRKIFKVGDFDDPQVETTYQNEEEQLPQTTNRTPKKKSSKRQYSPSSSTPSLQSLHALERIDREGVHHFPKTMSTELQETLRDSPSFERKHPKDAKERGDLLDDISFFKADGELVQLHPREDIIDSQRRREEEATKQDVHWPKYDVHLRSIFFYPSKCTILD